MLSPTLFQTVHASPNTISLGACTRAALAAAVALVVLPGALAAEASVNPRIGYWAGKLGKQGARLTEAQAVVMPGNKVQVGFNPKLVRPDGTIRPAVPDEMRLERSCDLDIRDCGDIGIGFGISRWKIYRGRMTGRWFLDKSVYAGHRIRRGERSFSLRWRARPRLRVTPNPAPLGARLTVRGSGFLPRELVYAGGGGPWPSLGFPVRAGRRGLFTRRFVAAFPGNWPAAYLYQRTCLSVCWVRGRTRVRIG